MDYKTLFTKAKELNITDIEVYEKRQKSHSIEMYNGKVSKNEMSDVTSFSTRALYDGKMGYVQFENADEDVDQLLAKLIENASSITSKKENFIWGGSEEYPTLPARENDYAKITYAEKVELLNKIANKINNYSELVYMVPGVDYEESETTIRIVNSKGLDLSGTTALAYVSGQVISKKDDTTKTSYFSSGAKMFADFNVDEIAEKAAKEAVDKLGGEPCLSGAYPVVLNKDAMGGLLAAFVSMFSGASAMNKLTALDGKENQLIMDKRINIVEEPLNDSTLFNRTFDDEGVSCYNKYFVENGVFKGFAHNLKTAKYFNTTSTGNGYKSRDGIGVSYCNVFINNGDNTYDELISSVEKGLLITELGGLHAGVNSVSGDFSLQSSGFMIENGKVTTPVTLIVLSGNFLKIMNDVDMIANDLKFSLSSVTAPSIKFNSMKVSGK